MGCAAWAFALAQVGIAVLASRSSFNLGRMLARSLALGLLVVASCGEATLPAEDTDDPPDMGDGDVAGATLEQGEVARARTNDTIVAGDLEVVVPPIGESVSTIAELDDGSWRAFAVEHGADDVVRVIPHVAVEEAGVASAASASAPPACKDKAFALANFKWNATWEWSFRAGSTPETNARSAVEQRLKEAAANVSASRNDCGLADKVTAKQKYLGRTKRSTNIIGKTASYKCGAPDGHNVVGFGVLPKGILGVACTWFGGDGAIEADVKLNDRGYRWFAGNTAPAGCTRAFSVEGVATHEVGHVFGLAHVSEGKHGNLTMSTQTRPCTARDTTLGLGDVLGLRKKYAP